MTAKREQILRNKRCLLAPLALLALFPWLHNFSYAEREIPTIPPGREFKWDIGPKDSRIEVEFMVTEYRVYEFHIGFGNKDDPAAKDQSWRDDDNNWAFINGGRNMLDNGIVVPVYIKVERLDAPPTTAPITEQIIDTYKLRAGGRLVLRTITYQELRPGKYRVTTMTTRESPLPGTLGSYLHIGFYPKAAVLNDN